MQKKLKSKRFLSLKKKQYIVQKNLVILFVFIILTAILIIFFLKKGNPTVNSKQTVIKQTVTSHETSTDEHTTEDSSQTLTTSSQTATAQKVHDSIIVKNFDNFRSVLDFNILEEKYFHFLLDKFPNFEPSPPDIAKFNKITSGNTYEDIKSISKKLSKVKLPKVESVSDISISNIIPSYIKTKIKIDKTILKAVSIIDSSVANKVLSNDDNEYFSRFCFRFFFSHRFFYRFFASKNAFDDITSSINHYTPIIKSKITPNSFWMFETFKKIIKDSYIKIFGFIKTKYSVSEVITAHDDSMWPPIHALHFRFILIIYYETLYYLLLIFNINITKSNSLQFTLKPVFIQYKENEQYLEEMTKCYKDIYIVVKPLEEADLFELLQNNEQIIAFSNEVKSHFLKITDIIENKMKIEIKIKEV